MASLELLNFPSHQLPIFIIPVGYAESATLSKSRLPLERVLHHERWENG